MSMIIVIHCGSRSIGSITEKACTHTNNPDPPKNPWDLVVLVTLRVAEIK